ncbi:hypothetical protein H257_18387 [Aphanomyces astaci]|uniref:Uncharacterized protein n=1 Tax=Aphanomyces astaci TaxID=112090 RepID=W4FDI8_APHAT|nr:hypothetical protein H257_18387 [Aphanomyces astaci]ETV64788.1 hypothetical protein H257_18387 [Aphanomyces astaci]|eukprot:XP_009845731.1 hypothetical protein H257_18387 [Aphanomyces astaci]
MTTLHQMHTSSNESVNFLCGEFIQSVRAVFVMLTLTPTACGIAWRGDKEA